VAVRRRGNKPMAGPGAGVLRGTGREKVLAATGTGGILSSAQPSRCDIDAVITVTM